MTCFFMKRNTGLNCVNENDKETTAMSADVAVLDLLLILNIFRAMFIY